MKKTYISPATEIIVIKGTAILAGSNTVSNDDIINDIKKLDLSRLTPIEALNELYSIQDKIKNRW